jgi:hypothetical protein
LAAFTALDKPTRAAARTVNSSTPLASKFLNDGAYLRAMFGTFWLALPIMALVISLAGLGVTGGSLALPPVAIVTAMAILGGLDTLSGFVGFGLWAVVTLAHSGISSASDIRFVVAVMCLGFTPLLLASGVRALRRATHSGGPHWWNRVIDLVLAPIVAWWACGSIIALLPSLAGADINLSSYSDVLPAAIAFSMVARVLLEEAAGQWFPNRLAQTNETAVPTPPAWQRWFGVALRAGIFYFAAGALIGDCWQLVVGSFLFVLPNILGIYAAKFPNSARLHALLPAGIVNLTLGVFLGGVTLAILLAVFGPVEDLAKMAFVILPLPTLTISLLKLFGRSAHPGTLVWYENPRFAWPLRIGTVAVIVAFAYLIKLV